MSDFLKVESLTKQFQKFTAVKNVSFSLKKGEAFALLGESGCGKTTLLRCIAGLENPQSGTIKLLDEDITQKPVHLRNIGIVFQDYAIFPHKSVADNITYGIKNGGDKKAVLKKMLELFKIADQKDKMPSQLSGGQLQRVAIARTLAANPSIVLLDEPFSNLDKKLAIELRTEIRAALKKEELPSVLVTHDQQEAFAFADKVAVMKEAEILQVGTPEDVYLKPKSLVIAEFLGHCQFIKGVSDGESITTSIGTIPVNNGVSGKVQALLRPENIAIEIDPDGRFSVEQDDFLGGNRMLIVTDGNIKLTVQMTSYLKVPLKTKVSLNALSAVPVFP